MAAKSILIITMNVFLTVSWEKLQWIYTNASNSRNHSSNSLLFTILFISTIIQSNPACTVLCLWIYFYSWNKFTPPVYLWKCCSAQSTVLKIKFEPFCLHWSCSPTTSHDAGDKSRGSNSNACKMDQPLSNGISNFHN